MTRLFCTDLAIERGEPQEGTGAMADRHLFIRWPKGKWRRPRYLSAGMIPELQAAMQGAGGKGRFVGLIEGGDGSELQLVSFPDGRTVVPADQAEAAQLVAAWGEGTPLAGHTMPRPVIFCCTDAKTDSCCARFGFLVYKALVADAGHFGFDVLQCSHIGGCHFAPSVIVMPYRHRYGRLTPAMIPAFLETLSQGEIYLPAFKGRADLPADQQLAEITAMRWAQERGLEQTDIQILDTVERGPTTRDIRLAIGDETLTVALEHRAFEVHGNCRDIDEGPGKTVLRWTLQSGSLPRALTSRPPALFSGHT